MNLLCNGRTGFPYGRANHAPRHQGRVHPESRRQYREARELGDKDGITRAVAEAELWLAEDWPTAHILETVRPTEETWLRDHDRLWERRTQLVGRIAVSINAMLSQVD